MKPATDPRRLDLATFVADAAHLEGRWPLASLKRLAEDQPSETPAAKAPDIEWAAQGEPRKGGGDTQTWLHVQAVAQVQRTCQRCLLPVELRLVVDRHLRFVPGEAAAAALDAESEDDVLELPDQLDLVALIEDEFLLELPFVPRHEVCPEPVPMVFEPEGGLEEAPTPNPFSALEALKRRSS